MSNIPTDGEVIAPLIGCNHFRVCALTYQRRREYAQSKSDRQRRFLPTIFDICLPLGLLLRHLIDVCVLKVAHNHHRYSHRETIITSYHSLTSLFFFKHQERKCPDRSEIPYSVNTIGWNIS